MFGALMFAFTVGMLVGVFFTLQHPVYMRRVETRDSAKRMLKRAEDALKDAAAKERP